MALKHRYDHLQERERGGEREREKWKYLRR